MKSIFFFLIYMCAVSTDLWSQSEPIAMEGTQPEMKVDRYFNLHYRQALNRVKRVYPLALEAKKQILEIEEELADIEKKRKQKKYTKSAHKELKDQFMWDIKDLYISEGIMLMKLIHRETGMSVGEIIEKYKGKMTANVYNAMGKLYDQDLYAQYDPTGEDWITEIVIQDILSGRVKMDLAMEPLDKVGYKTNMKEYRQDVRDYRKEKRKEKREEKRQSRKESRSKK